jgi:bacterial/archaeal transporter family-2 protein
VDKAVVAGGAMVIAGGLVGLQAPINATLGRTVGSLPAASISFAVGLTALVFLTLLVGGGFGDVGEVGGVPWWALIGGLLGAVYVTCALTAVKTLGAGGVTAATISGQLGASVVIDRLGWFGLDERPLSAARVVGVALLAVGTFLILRD